MNIPKNDTKMKEIEVKNLVYQATFALFEHLEHNKRYQGNGHHLAQRVCELVWLKYSDDEKFTELINSELRKKPVGE